MLEPTQSPSRLLPSAAHTNGLSTKWPKSYSYLTGVCQKPSEHLIYFRQGRVPVPGSHQCGFFPSSHTQGSRSIGRLEGGVASNPAVVTSRTSQNNRVGIRTGRQYKRVHSLQCQISYSKECISLGFFLVKPPVFTKFIVYQHRKKTPKTKKKMGGDCHLHICTCIST